MEQDALLFLLNLCWKPHNIIPLFLFIKRTQVAMQMKLAMQMKQAKHHYIRRTNHKKGQHPYIAYINHKKDMTTEISDQGI